MGATNDTSRRRDSRVTPPERMTVTFDDDVASAIDRLRRDEGMGLNEAVNRLARAGLAAYENRQFHQRSVSMGKTIDVSDISDALDVAEGPDRR